jgi:hypothetical protein
MHQAGYSGRPLAAKLGLKPGMTCWQHQMPEDTAVLLQGQMPDIIPLAAPKPGLDCAHIFVTERQDLETQLDALGKCLAPDGMIWVSWPKKASKVSTTITEDIVRQICLPKGLVDVKVCAVDDIWSGLKLVIRKELRSEQKARLAEVSH